MMNGAEVATQGEKGRRRTVQALMRFGSVIGFIVMCVLFSGLSPVFLTVPNIMDVLRQSSILGLISFGLTMPMVTGRFDISLGFQVDVTSVAVAGAMAAGWPIFGAILLGLAVGGGLGFMKGWLIAYVGMSDFIGTLAVGSICTGLSFLYTKGYPITTGIPQSFLKLAEGYLGPVPMPVVILIVVFALFYIFLYHSKPGRYLYAIGGNENAAFLSGINTKAHIAAAYVICGVTTSFAAVILTARLASGQPIGGDGFTLDAIAAVFIGMTAFREGEANLPGTLLGVLLIGVLNNGLTLLNVQYYYQDILKGVIILLAVAATAIQRRQRSTV